MSIEKVVDVVITRETANVTQTGFGRPMILGIHTRFSEDIKIYSSLTAVAEDFETSDEEYKAAAKIFAQSPAPKDIAIGKRSTAVAQIDDIEIITLEDADYTVIINGTPFTYAPGGVPANNSAVTNALIALINAGSEPVTASPSGVSPDEDLVLTADNAGEPFTATVTSNMTLVHTVANHGVQDDLQAIYDSGDTGNDWYALCLISRNEYDVLEASIWVAANKKLFITASSDSAVKGSGSTDIASQLQALSYDRVAIIYSADAANYPDAAWLGRMLPYNPGSATWAHKVLTGITYDELTDTEQTNLEGKNCNYYVNRAGSGRTHWGYTCEGEWIDVIRGVDWLEARMQEKVYALNIAVPKIPFTNKGIGMVGTPIEQTLIEAVDADVLSDYTITLPDAADFTATQKQTRQLTGITFTGTLAGAVHKTTINGSVSV